MVKITLIYSEQKVLPAVFLHFLTTVGTVKKENAAP